MSDNWEEGGVFRRFYQGEFVDAGYFEFFGLARYGYVYYPHTCLEK